MPTGRASLMRAVCRTAALAAVVVVLIAQAATAAPPQAPWRVVGPEAGRTTHLAVSPHSGNTVVAHAGEGLFRTTDGGAGWRRVDTAATGELTQVAFDAADPARVWAAGERGLWRSGDGAATWSAAAIPGGAGPVLAVAVAPGNARSSGSCAPTARIGAPTAARRGRSG